MKALPAACLLLFFGLNAAQANCVEDFRPATVGDTQVNVKAYICRSATAHFRIAFHRLSVAAVSLLISGDANKSVREIVGTPRIVTNSITQTVQDLLDSYSATHEPEFGRPIVNVSVPRGGSASDDYSSESENIRSPEIKVLDTDWIGMGEFYYPAVDEIKILLAGRIPNTLEPKDKKTLWRFVTNRDLDEYQTRLLSYNNLLRAHPDQVYEIYGEQPRTIQLMSFLSGGRLPRDFSVIRGSFDEGGCASAGWVFNYLPRVPIVDVIVIENLSSATSTVSGISGTYAEGGLRPPLDRQSTGDRQFPIPEITIKPHASIAIPTGLVFAPSDELREYTSSNYAFGPEYAVAGITINGQSVVFEQKSANFMQLSLLNEEGSCPFLQSFRHDGVWIEHGKVLHYGLGIENKYTEAIKFKGLRTKFRIDEREPETAFIDQVILQVELHDGRIHHIMPSVTQLADIDESYLSLRWGNIVEIDFVVPAVVRVDMVKESALRVTGYYEPYTLGASSSQIGNDILWTTPRTRLRGSSIFCRGEILSRIGAAWLSAR